MKKCYKLIITLAITLVLAINIMPVSAEIASIDEILILAPGQTQQREFSLNDSYNIKDPQNNIGDFIVVNIGEAGTLSIELTTQAHIEFGGFMDYSLIGIAYSLDEGLQFITEKATTPYTISTSVAVNSIFGFAYIGTIIKKVSPEWSVAEWPIPFTISFTISEPTAVDETPEDNDTPEDDPEEETPEETDNGTTEEPSDNATAETPAE